MPFISVFSGLSIEKFNFQLILKFPVKFHHKDNGQTTYNWEYQSIHFLVPLKIAERRDCKKFIVKANEGNEMKRRKEEGENNKKEIERGKIIGTNRQIEKFKELERN